MDSFQRGVISLIRSALSGEKQEIPSEFDWQKVTKLAKKHQIQVLIYYGLVTSGAQPPPEVQAVLETDAFQYLALDRNQVYAISQLLKAFEENGIDHMPLKGTLLKPLYPKSELRCMSDADILIKPEQYEAIRSIMLKLGYTEGLESDHEYIWKKENFFTAELHKRLIPSYNKDYYEYYGDGWQLGKIVNGYCYAMTDEDQLIYLFTHFAKHYRDSGIGIRHLIDLEIYLKKKPELDFAYIDRELQKLQLDVFYGNVLKTLKAWFEGGDEDEVTDFVTERIFGSGSYGTHTGHLLSAAVKDAKTSRKGFHFQKTWRLIFPPYKDLIPTFPVLKKCPFLLPVLWIYRWFRAIFFRRKTIKKIQKDMKNTTAERVENYQEELHFVGLDFNFKE